MTEVKEARKLIEENCNQGKVTAMTLLEANGNILAENVLALIDTPPFNQSAMDGYAFSFESSNEKNELKIIGEIQAGNFSSQTITQSSAVRIYTGAPLPQGADTVVMQEKVIVNGDSITIMDEQLLKGGNVRLRGSQTKKGDIALEAGRLLTPAGVSFLAGIGIENVNVYATPTVSIIVTGKELVVPGNAIREGEIYESNSSGLIAALNSIHIKPVSVDIVDDDETEITNTILKHLSSDILILTGGVSVGDYDFVASALEKAGVKKIFHKVKQKPGKPFYFGRYKDTIVFALPGNPAAVLTCFYAYIVPAISILTKKEYFRELQLPLANDYKKKAGLTHFLKGKINGNEVDILNSQESYLMNSFALADCIVELEEEKELFKKGELVNVKMII